MTLCVSPSVTRSTSILMLFLDKNFYFFGLFSLARSVSKEERRKDFIRIGNGVIFRLHVYGFETSNGNFDFTCLSNFFL